MGTRWSSPKITNRLKNSSYLQMLLLNIINGTTKNILYSYVNKIYASYKNLSKEELLWTYLHPIENININYEYM